MSARLLMDASMTLPLLGSCSTEEAMLASADISGRIQASLQSLALYLSRGEVGGPSFDLS